MASDRTAAKRYLFVTAAGTPRALLPCPSCSNAMAIDDTHLRWAIGTGQVAWDAVEVAQASHTVPSTDGGRKVALECEPCNAQRGAERWDAPTGTLTATEGKLKRYEHSTGQVLRSAEALRNGR